MPDEKGPVPQPPYEAARAERATTAEGTLERPSGKHDPYAAFRFSAFKFYTAGNLISVIGRLMFIVAVELEMYERPPSATAVGVVGPVIAVAGGLPSLPAGQLADRFPPQPVVLLAPAP